MGCVSSKHLKKQALLEESTPAKKKLSHTASADNEVSLEDYHRHLVALTSSSYGLLKVDVPETPENVKKSTTRMGSMNDMYDKLKVLESLESGPKSWNEVSSVLQTLKPSLGRSISMPEQDSNKVGVQETINVADIMQGLDEGASGSSSPSKDVCAISVSTEKLQPSPPASLPGVSSTRRHKKFDNAASIENPTQDLQMLPLNANAVAIQKHPTLLPEEVSRVFAHTAGSHHKVNTLNENVQPSDAEQKYLTRSNAGDQQNQHVSTKSAITVNKSIVEDSSVCRDYQPGLNPNMPSNIAFSSSSRRLKLTLNLEYEKSTFFTGTPLSQDALSPTGSSARRSLVDVFTEPGSPLFDPALLASYEKALKELRKEEWSIVHDSNELPEKIRLTRELDMDLEDSPPVQVSEKEQFETGESSDEDDTNNNMKIQSYDPLDEFEWKCPPNGEEIVVLYTTTLRGIRKTFEDCNYLREILHSFSIGIDERDVSMHAIFRNELRELLGGPVQVPRMFIKGRYIGGVDDATKLHEEGKLSHLLEGLPKDLNTGICDGCGGIRFVPCLECSGSCKIVDQDQNVLRCPGCNENGLIHCPICS